MKGGVSCRASTTRRPQVLAAGPGRSTHIHVSAGGEGLDRSVDGTGQPRTPTIRTRIRTRLSKNLGAPAPPVSTHSVLCQGRTRARITEANAAPPAAAGGPTPRSLTAWKVAAHHRQLAQRPQRGGATRSKWNCVRVCVQNGCVSAGPNEGHDGCMPGCFLAGASDRLKHRAKRYKIGFPDLLDLVAATDGMCMICRRCHASYIDQGRTGSKVRGIVCKWCRTRLSLADGAVGNMGLEANHACRCSPGTVDWMARIRFATAGYLKRAAQVSACGSNLRQPFTQLVRKVEEDGVDPAGAWRISFDEIPKEYLAPSKVRSRPSGTNTGPQTVPPMQRDQCPAACLSHEEHLYIACFDEPTVVRDRDHHPQDPVHDYPIRHYVGWTTQQPPGKRLGQHGSATRRSLVLLVPGTVREEHGLKVVARCPKCNDRLWYYLARRP